MPNVVNMPPFPISFSIKSAAVLAPQRARAHVLSRMLVQQSVASGRHFTLFFTTNLQRSWPRGERKPSFLTTAHRGFARSDQFSSENMMRFWPPRRAETHTSRTEFFVSDRCRSKLFSVSTLIDFMRSDPGLRGEQQHLPGSWPPRRAGTYLYDDSLVRRTFVNTCHLKSGSGPRGERQHCVSHQEMSVIFDVNGKQILPPVGSGNVWKLALSCVGCHWAFCLSWILPSAGCGNTRISDQERPVSALSLSFPLVMLQTTSSLEL
ncbi:hypothetical protein Hypma_006147 [Hypsizygus marmoreus]|uniref:Uncharacterized protein n=1 Tax=Hypsizygus marmoreus TaxID=39966 RepID=A0A369K425_HYPMA|nr:hypothetical protein Hypma_006147 [Hypsizygus marmoreus]